MVGVVRDRSDLAANSDTLNTVIVSTNYTDSDTSNIVIVLAKLKVILQTVS